MKFKITPLLYCLLCVMALNAHAAEKPGEPLLRWDFSDGKCVGITAGGEKVPGVVEGKTMGSREFFGEPSLELSPGGTSLPLSERYFDINQGTVVFWIKPLGWPSGEKVGKEVPLQLLALFAVGNSGGSNWSQLCYLVFNPGTGAVSLDYRSFCSEPSPRTIYTAQKLEKDALKQGEWSFIAVSWSTMELNLYFNGKRIGSASYGLPIRKKLSEYWKLQLMPSKWWKWQETLHSAVAGAALYNTTLDDARIAELYAAARIARQAGKVSAVTAPLLRAPVRIDGQIDADEWSDASRVPLLRTNDNGMLDTSKMAWVMLKHDREKLYVACRSEGTSRVAGQPGAADSKVYEGSVFEIAGRLPEAKNPQECFQIAVGPNGAHTSRRPKEGTGSPAFTAAGSLLPEQKGWECEIAIPLQEIGFVSPGKYDMQFVLHRPENNEATRNWLLWSMKHPRKMYFDGMGKVQLGNESKAWRAESLGNLSNGEKNVAVSGPGLTCTLTAADGQPVPEKLLPGSYRLKLSDGEGNYDFESMFFVRDPLHTAIGIHAAENRLEVKVDAGGMFIAGNPLDVDVRLTNASGKLCAEGRSKLNASAGTVNLPLSNPPCERYDVTVSVTANGKTMTRVHSFEKPSDIFLRDLKGMEKTVYPPWKPLVKNGNQVSTPFITYTFDRGAFPVRAVAHGEPVLATAPKLTAVIGGVEYLFVTGEEKSDSEKPEEFIASGRMMGGPLELYWRRKLAYDGMMRYDLRISSAQQVTIDRLQWKMKVPENVARYSLSPIYNHEWTTSGKVDVFPNAWLTNNRTGITVFTDNDANWVYAPGSKPMKLRRSSGGDAEVILQLIEKPVLLTKPAKYVLGLGATPTKPPRTDWRKFHSDGWGRLKGQNLQVVGWAGMENWLFKRTYDFSQPYDNNFEYWRKLMLGRPAKIKSVFPYGYLGAMPDNTPIFDYYGSDWSYTVKGFAPPRFEQQIDPNDRQYFYFGNPVCRNKKAYADFITYYVDEFMGKFSFIPGPYFDGGGVEETDTPYGDTDLSDVFDPQRKVYNNNIFGLRDIAERFFKITRRHRGDTGLVYFHSWQDYRPAVASFFDIIYPGEEFMHSIMRGLQVYVDAPPEQWQSNYSGSIYGTSVQFLPQYRNYGGSLLTMPKEKRRQYTKPLLMMCLLHDVPLSGGFYPDVEKAWEILDSSLQADADFHGYWQQHELSSGHPDVKISYYRTPGSPELLVILGNTGRKDQEIRLTADKANYCAIDAETGDKVDLLSPVKVENWGFRILKLTPL